MKKLMKRATAGMLFVALVLTSPASGMTLAEETVHVQDAAKEARNPLSVTAEELAGGKVFLVTAELLNEDGSLTVDGGSWERIVIPKEANAKKQS